MSICGFASERCVVEIPIERRILATNDELAAKLRSRFKAAGTFVVNLISSPGAGKTSLLERTAAALAALPNPPSLAVIEGDIATEQDAARIRKHGVPAVQINTHGDCHLDARMVSRALDELAGQVNLDKLDILIVENVGNLVCPTEFDLGEDAKVVVASVAEGADKPSKYPATFLNARVMVVNKVDLLPYVDCDLDRLIGDARAINPKLVVFPLSCRSGEGLTGWIEWLVEGATRRDR
jgi:hydrogenase nickel incorporation protein HypB